MPLLTRDDILNAKDVQYEDVPCPEWAPEGTDPNNAVARCASLGAKAYQELAADQVDAEGNEIAAARASVFERVCARGIVNEKGDRIFTDADVVALGKKSHAPIQRCYRVIARLSGMSKTEQERMEGNSEGGPTEGSNTG